MEFIQLVLLLDSSWAISSRHAANVVCVTAAPTVETLGNTRRKVVYFHFKYMSRKLSVIEF